MRYFFNFLTLLIGIIFFGGLLTIFSIAWVFWSYGQNLPDFLPKYWRIAPDSKTEIGFPPGPLGSIIAGILLFGDIFKKEGLNYFSCFWNQN